MMQSNPESEARLRIQRVRHAYGIWFGVFLGLAFAVTSWGVDALVLQRTNGLLPWLKLSVAAAFCALVGGLTGWLSARLNRPIWSIVLWLGAAVIFAWLTVALPFRIAPQLVTALRPDLEPLLTYSYFEGFSSRIGLAYVWVAIFAGIAGLLQVPLSESAIFSTTPMGRVMPIIVCMALIGVGGLIVDALNNEPLRTASTALNDTVQFWLDHQGREMDPTEARRMHVGALRTVQDSITVERSLIVSGYDEPLGQIQVLALFSNARVKCDVYYSQLITCRQASAVP